MTGDISLLFSAPYFIIFLWVSVLISANIKRFSIYGMQDFLYLGQDLSCSEDITVKVLKNSLPSMVASTKIMNIPTSFHDLSLSIYHTVGLNSKKISERQSKVGFFFFFK